MPSLRRKQPTTVSIPKDRPFKLDPVRDPYAVKGRGMTLGRISQKSGLLRVKQIAMITAQYNQVLELIYEHGYSQEDALTMVVPALPVDDRIFFLTGVTPDE